MDGIFNALKMEEITDQYDSAELDSQKGIAIVAFLFEFLFFLPIVSNKDSAYAKKVANQSLTILVGSIAISVIRAILGAIPVVGGILSFIVLIAFYALAVSKIVDAAQGKVRTMPFGIEIPAFK